jgi:hypothetical protein
MAESSFLYSYNQASTLQKGINTTEITLSHFNEDLSCEDIPCYFWGRLVNPYLVAKCLTTLSKVVQSRFTMTWQQMMAMKDPIISVGSNKMRFEGFSSCNGVYSRLDILPEGLDGEFLGSGTTNVDFNEPMLNALNGVSKSESIMLSVGQKEFIIEKKGNQFIERKVSLPDRWIKGLTTIQVYLCEMEEVFRIGKIQILQLFQSLPRSETKENYFLIFRANKFQFSPVNNSEGVFIGGLHRLRLLEGLIPFADNLIVYTSKESKTTAFVLFFNNLRFVFALSPDVKRGFSGEGKILDGLTDNLPINWITSANSIFKTNDEFNPFLIGIENDFDSSIFEKLTHNLSSIGLLGFDLETRHHFYRRLPFKMERILRLNPRLKNAKLLLENSDTILKTNTAGFIEAKVKGSQVWHTVLIVDGNPRCTCSWFTNHLGSRGACKHILSVKLMLNL